MTQQLATTQNTQLAKPAMPLAEYMRQDEVKALFKGMFGSDTAAMSYIQSVIILVQSSDPGEYSLQSCSNESVVRAALRAASLRVSVDPALRQAYLIPRRNKKNGGRLEANFQLHYSEIRNRAMRTGMYWFINVSPVYQGSEVLENIYTGLHVVKLDNGLITAPTQADGLRPVNQNKGKVIGWLGYMKTTHGAESTVYMSVEDIEKHVSHYNQYWRDSIGWKNSRATMEQKTVLLALLKKADLGDPRAAELKTILEGNEDHEESAIDGEFTEQDADIHEAKPSPAPSAQMPRPAPDAPSEVLTNYLKLVDLVMDFNEKEANFAIEIEPLKIGTNDEEITKVGKALKSKLTTARAAAAEAALGYE